MKISIGPAVKKASSLVFSVAESAIWGGSAFAAFCLGSVTLGGLGKVVGAPVAALFGDGAIQTGATSGCVMLGVACSGYAAGKMISVAPIRTLAVAGFVASTAVAMAYAKAEFSVRGPGLMLCVGPTCGVDDDGNDGGKKGEAEASLKRPLFVVPAASSGRGVPKLIAG